MLNYPLLRYCGTLRSDTVGNPDLAGYLDRIALQVWTTAVAYSCCRNPALCLGGDYQLRRRTVPAAWMFTRQAPHLGMMNNTTILTDCSDPCLQAEWFAGI